MPFIASEIDVPASPEAVQTTLVDHGASVLTSDHSAQVCPLIDRGGPAVVVWDERSVTFIRISPVAPGISRLHLSRHTRLPRFVGPFAELLRRPRLALTRDVERLATLFSEPAASPAITGVDP